MAKSAPPGRTSRSGSGERRVSLRSSEGSRAFILEQLSGLRDLIPKPMFGGLGLYADGVFFGLVARDRLYLKVDDSNRARFERAGSAPFRPHADRPFTMSYWDVPADVLEDADELLVWARTAIAVAKAAPVKPRKRPTRAGLAARKRPSSR